MCDNNWFQTCFVTVLAGSETGPKFPLATRPVQQSGLWKFWPNQVLSMRVKKNLSAFPFFIGLWVPRQLLTPAARWPKAVSVKVWPCWGKVLWGQQAFPFLLHWNSLSSLSFTTAGASRSCCCCRRAHGFTRHLNRLVPNSSPRYQCQLGRELHVKLKLSWTDLNFTTF